MNIYKPGDIVKDKHTDLHFMILSITPGMGIDSYKIQSIKYGGIYYNADLDIDFVLVQKAKK